VPKELVLHRGGAVILPVLDDGKFVLINNYRWAIGRELLELPAGVLESLEDPLRCATRELEQETGYSAGRVEPLCRFYASPGFCNELLHAYIATDLTPGPQRLDPDEKISVITLTLEQVEQAMHNGKIMDGKSLTTLLYYQRYRMRGHE